MSTSRRSFAHPSTLRRPLGPRCHGGASSLLRLGFGAVAQRLLAPRVSDFVELGDSFDATLVEHVVGHPVRAERRSALS